MCYLLFNEAKRCGAERFGAERSDAMRRITERSDEATRGKHQRDPKVFSLKPTSHYLSLFEAYRLRHHTAALGPLDLRISRLLFSNPFPLLTCTFAPDLDANYTQDPSACLQPHNGIYFLYDAKVFA